MGTLRRLGHSRILAVCSHHQYLTEDLLGWQLRDNTYVPIPLQLDRPRGAWVGHSSVLDADWGLDTDTGTLRLWNQMVFDSAGSWDGPREGSRTGRPGSCTGTGSRGGGRTPPSPAVPTGTSPQRPLGPIMSRWRFPNGPWERDPVIRPVPTIFSTGLCTKSNSAPTAFPTGQVRNRTGNCRLLSQLVGIGKVH